VNSLAGAPGNGGAAARPQLIRALNERLLLNHLRSNGPCSRADLARSSGLSKPTVSLALASVERAGLVRRAGRRTGAPGPAARLYEIRPDAGFVLGLDVGRRFLRGAIGDLAGVVRAKTSRRVHAAGALGRVTELVDLAGKLCDSAGVSRAQVTQVIVGSPGRYDPRSDAIVLPGLLQGWARPAVLAQLRDAFGPGVLVENDVDAAALAERAHGLGQDVRDFAFVHVGTGIGMALVLDGSLHRGAHGVSGEIAFLPFWDGLGASEKDVRRRGSLEAVASAAAVVRAARRAGIRGPVSARRVFALAAQGDERAGAVVAGEALLVAKAICAIVMIADPELIVLGGGIGQAPGFAAAVAAELRKLAPVAPEVRVSALGTDAVVDGCLAAATEHAWERLTRGHDR
jgi:predicted NBD/HSP70 family sugar kinase